MENIKVNLTNLEIIQKEYNKHKNDYQTLNEIKEKVESGITKNEINNILDSLIFNMDVDVACMFSEIEKIKEKM